MKKTNLDEYYDFFLELPPADYLNDIEIQDEYEKSGDYAVRGLSDEQVSQIARDSLTDAKRTKRPHHQANEGHNPSSAD